MGCLVSMLIMTDCYMKGPHSIDQLIRWGLEKMATIMQMAFSNAYTWMKIIVYGPKFHWWLFPGAQLTLTHCDLMTSYGDRDLGQH